MTRPDEQLPRDRLVALAREQFQFLESERGFRFEMDDRADRSVLAYVGEQATFEVELDWRERAAFVLVCRTVEGRRPPGYYMHRGGQVRMHLAQGLELAAGTGPAATAELREATRRSGSAAMESQLTLSASVLRRSIDDLLASVPVLFPAQQP